MRLQSPEIKWKRPQVHPAVPLTPGGQDRVALENYFLRNRVIFLDSFIDDKVANRLVASLIGLDALDSTRDIKIYVHATGGSLYAMFALLDTMASLKADVTTVAFGQVASHASLVVAAGTRGKRFMMKNARLMVQQPMGGFADSAYDAVVTAQELYRNHKAIMEYYSRFTGLEVSRLERMTYCDKFMGPEEAIELGFVDAIVEDAPRKNMDHVVFQPRPKLPKEWYE